MVNALKVLALEAVRSNTVGDFVFIADKVGTYQAFNRQLNLVFVALKGDTEDAVAGNCYLKGPDTGEKQVPVSPELRLREDAVVYRNGQIAAQF